MVPSAASAGGPAVLGVNVAHDASACLLVDGELRAATAEERLARRKHVRGAPRRAIASCLEQGGLAGLDAVDCVVVNQHYPVDFAAELRRKGFPGQLVCGVSHHLLHAYYAAAASGQSSCAILVVDGSGYHYAEHLRRGSPLLGPPPAFPHMEEAESSFKLLDGEIDLVERRWALWAGAIPSFRFPSLGHMFTAASKYIFGSATAAGKTMGLAPYGDASTFPEPIVSYGADGISVDTEWMLDLPPRSKQPAHLDGICRDVAAKVQAELEQALLFLAQRLFEKTDLPSLCFSGGVALNSVANARLRREGPFAEVFVTPAAGDSGVSVGAAAFGHALLTGEIPRWDPYSDFLGLEHGAEHAAAAVRRMPDRVRHTVPSDHAATAAEDIAAGRVVGWSEGRSELGPRALGHRSILCDARIESIRDHLNERVKFREPFRPYAAAVLEEHADRYFELEWVDRFMLSVASIRPEHRAGLASVCHVDGTCRVQMVPPRAGAFRRLIETFFELTGLPLVLNTSLNIRGEPIVETPEDAIRCFLGTNIDLLYLEGMRLEKPTLDGHKVEPDLVPVPGDSIALERGSQWTSGGWSTKPPTVRRRHTGHLVPLEDRQCRVLLALDGRTTVGEIVGDSALGSEEQILDVLLALQRQGLVSMAYGAVSPQAAEL
jgi:carbamoyltransferase